MHVISKSTINRVFPTGKSKEDKQSNSSSIDRKDSGATASTVGTYDSTYEQSKTHRQSSSKDAATGVNYHKKTPEVRVSPTLASSSSNKTSSPPSTNSSKNKVTEPTPSITIGDAKGANFKETRSNEHKKESSSSSSSTLGGNTYRKSNQQEKTTTTSRTSVSGRNHDGDDESKANHSTDLIDAIAKRASVTDTVATPDSKSQDPPGSHAIPVDIVVREEDKEDVSKATLTLDGEDETCTSRSSTAIKEEAQFFYQEQYGLDGNPNEEHKRPTFDMERRSAQALCYATGCGGVYTEDQVEWITGLFRSKGYDNMIVEAVPTLLKQSAALLDLELVVESKKLITEDMKNGATLLVYDMYRCASVAEFPQEQMCAIAMIAEEIGVGNFGQLEGMRKQVEAEILLKKERIKLLYPEGHPQLDEQYEGLVGTDNSGNASSKKSDPPMMHGSGEQQSCRKPASRTSSRDNSGSHQSVRAKSPKSNGSGSARNSSSVDNNTSPDSKASRNPVPRTSSRTSNGRK